MEEDQPEDFFIPYVWSLVFSSGVGLYWNPHGIELFSMDSGWKNNMKAVFILMQIRIKGLMMWGGVGGDVCSRYTLLSKCLNLVHDGVPLYAARSRIVRIILTPSLWSFICAGEPRAHSSFHLFTTNAQLTNYILSYDSRKLRSVVMDDPMFLPLFYFI